MHRNKHWTLPFCAVAVFAVLCSVFTPTPACAQDNSWDGPPGSDQATDQPIDPPTRVARMNYIQGAVSFQPGGEGDWVDAVPNRPLTTGDNLWSDQNSRAELHVGSTSIRIGGNTSLTFLELDDNVLQLRLAQGSTLVRVRHLDDDDTVEIDTPTIAFLVQRTGEYRVDVQPDGQTTLVDVYQGRGQAIGGGNDYTILANQQALFSGNPDQGLNYEVDALPFPDGFSNWAFARDRRDDQSQSANYVSPEMTGYEDLDDNGTWSFAGNYGPVWIPTSVPSGWAPYRYGHWAFVAPWGWTWVDDAPWGFAPFHYGRWVVMGSGWGWVPGPVAAHPVYAPALVAFVGGGGGFQLSASFGGGAGVAWFPLGPGDVFIPAYHVSRAYVNQVNVTNTVVNVTKITNVYNTYNSTTVNNVNVNRVAYVNQSNVTVVSRDTFVNARPIAKNVVAVPAREVAQAPISHMSGIQPVRGSVMGSGKPTTVAPPAAVIKRQVVAKHAPAPPPMPFGQRQDKLMVRPVAQVAHPGSQPASHPSSQPMIRQGNQPANGGEMNRTPPAANRQQPAPAERPMPQESRPAMAQPEPRPSQPMNNREENPQESRAQENKSQPKAQEAKPQANEQQNWSHPQVRPAPVQPKSEGQARDEENKQKNWQAKPQPPKPQPEATKPEAKGPDPKKPDPKKDDKNQ